MQFNFINNKSPILVQLLLVAKMQVIVIQIQKKKKRFNVFLFFRSYYLVIGCGWIIIVFFINLNNDIDNIDNNIIFEYINFFCKHSKIEKSNKILCFVFCCFVFNWNYLGCECKCKNFAILMMMMILDFGFHRKWIDCSIFFVCTLFFQFIHSFLPFLLLLSFSFHIIVFHRRHRRHHHQFLSIFISFLSILITYFTPSARCFNSLSFSRSWSNEPTCTSPTTNRPTNQSSNVESEYICASLINYPQYLRVSLCLHVSTLPIVH